MRVPFFGGHPIEHTIITSLLRMFVRTLQRMKHSVQCSQAILM